jgi:DNA-binding LacI/PurR family transcriptional regulator
LPSIDGLHEALGRDGLTVLLVNIAETRETVVRALAARRYSAPVLLDPNGKTTESYRVAGTPTVFIIGRDGVILGSAVGPGPWADPAGRALLEALLRGRM